MVLQQGRPAAGLVVHSNRGSEYASAQFKALWRSKGFTCSISRQDNAVAEAFFLNLKMERVWQRSYANHSEAKIDIASYIVCFYSSERLHPVLDNLTHSAYERKIAATKPIAVSEIT
jgi:putative transposase